MYDKIDSEKLINAIKTRPALYRKSDELYHSLKYKHNLWHEVCLEVHENWNQLSPEQKGEYAHLVQRRWKHMRSCFRREVLLQKKENMKLDEGKRVKKRRRRRYQYYKKMLFLKDGNEGNDGNDGNDVNDDNDANIDNGRNYGNDEESDSLVDLFESYQPDEMTFDDSESSTEVKDIAPINVQNSCAENLVTTPVVHKRSNLDGILDVLKHLKGEEENEDRHFMLSLVPIFKKMSEKQKVTARIEILKVLQNIAF